jgi:hypothetical protein
MVGIYMMKTYKVIENDEYKLVRSEDYNYNFNKKNGFFARWGKMLDDDPIMAPSCEIADIEISTICSGIGKTMETRRPCSWCSPAGTMVYTANGEVAIEDLNVGDKVLSVNFNGKHPYIRLNNIEEVYKRDYNDDIVEITLDNGSVINLTPEHIVILKNGQEALAGDLQEGDDVFSVSEFKRCKVCNKVLIEKNSYNRYYCSKECWENNHKKICLICGSEFYTKRKNERYCCIDLNGSVKHALRNVYQSMIDRCFDETRNNYKYYGAKGIRVCDRWFVFKNFIDDMGKRPKGYTLDRIDNNGNYCPENCRWVSKNEQRINRKRFKNSSRKYKGVCLYGNKWKAECRYNGKNNYLGLFDTQEDAAKAYNNAIKAFYPKTYKMYINEICDENCENKKA